MQPYTIQSLIQHGFGGLSGVQRHRRMAKRKILQFAGSMTARDVIRAFIAFFYARGIAFQRHAQRQAQANDQIGGRHFFIEAAFRALRP